MMARNTCEFVVGRLLEIRVLGGYQSEDDVSEMSGMIAEQMAGVSPTTKVSIVADWRHVRVMPPEVAARAREMFARNNPAIERSAVLTSPEGSTSNLQVLRLLREAQNPNRRLFTSPDAVYGWLSEVLDAKEAARLKVFLDQPLL